MTFKNPLAFEETADPFMTYDPVTGYYYVLYTTYMEGIRIHRSRHAALCRVSKSVKTVYEIGDGGDICGDLWAPEMHKAQNGLWYIYTSGSVKGRGYEKHLFILESESADPFDGFHFKCLPTPDVFSIDPTVIHRSNGKSYICASRVIEKNGIGQQVLEITELENPYTFGKHSGIIAEATYPWEKVRDDIIINEGAFFVERGERLFLFYSANGCWQNDYCLGVMELVGDDPCDISCWKKSEKPFLTHGNGVYGPGHASFFRSPDGTEIWCCYHTLPADNPDEKETNRFANLLKISFDESGHPIPTVTPSWDTFHDAPSGEIED